MEDRHVEPLFVLLSLLALVACAARFVPSAAQAPPADPTPSSPSPLTEGSPFTLSLDPVELEQSCELDVPDGCPTGDEECQAYLNVEDGYCPREPGQDVDLRR